MLFNTLSNNKKIQNNDKLCPESSPVAMQQSNCFSPDTSLSLYQTKTWYQGQIDASLFSRET